ncbi:unnamed protein product [Ixodes persulcatus]
METPAVAGAEEAVKALPVPEEVLEVPRPAEPAAEPNPSAPAVVEAESSTPAPVQPVPSEPAVVDAKSSEPAPVEPEPSEPAVADAAEAAPAAKSESTVPAGEGSEPTPPQQVGLFTASALCSGSLLGDDKTESQQDLPEASQPSAEAPASTPAAEEAVSSAAESPNVPSDAVKVVAQQLKDMAIKEDPQQGTSTEASAGHDETGISAPPGTVPEPAEPSEKSAKKRRCVIN